MAEMSSLASATFWPRGAIRSAVAGGIGLLAAIGAYVIGIPIISGLVIIVGLFMVALTVSVFVAEVRGRNKPAK
jgi:hypothetical protein